MKQHILTISALVGMMACTETKKDDPKPNDTSKPVIEVIGTTPSAEKKENSWKIEAAAGQTLTLQLKLTDNTELKQVKIDIHDAFDGHSHGRAEQSKWALSTVLPVSGTNQTIAPVLTVPSDVVAGPYHLMVKLIDASGNEGEFVEFDLHLSNQAEQASITGLNLSATSLASGNQLTISGLTISDNKNLNGGSIEIHLEGQGKELSYSVGSNLLNNTKTVAVDPFTFTIPADYPKGEYEVHVKVKDADGNISELHEDVSVI